MTSKIPYYSVRERHGRRLGYWQPTPKMKAAGFRLVSCGDDGPEAWTIAAAWNERWAAARTSGEARSDREGDGYVYFLKVGEAVKIGFSTKPQERVAELSTAIASAIDMFMAVRGTRADEANLHRRLAAYRQRGEWFVAAPAVMRTAMRSLMFGRPIQGGLESADEQMAPKALTA